MSALLLGALLPPLFAQDPDSLPDIDVLYIERTPRYPGYRPDYNRTGWEGVPVLVERPSGRPLSPSEAARVKRWPSSGETVTFTAHIQNRGTAPAPAYEYAWLVDGREVSRGALSAPHEPGKEVTAELKWPWKPGRHTIRFVADPLFKLRDRNLHNNSRADATDAWSLIWAVDRQTYEAMNRARNFLGTSSFEDWAQWHIDHMNHLFDISPTPWDGVRKGPSGSVNPSLRPRVRCDRVIVVDSTEGVWDRTLGQGVEPLDAGYDGAWTFGRREDGKYDEWAGNVDWGLIHEWGHQLGLTDLYALDRPGFQNLVSDENGDPLLIGHLSSQAGFMMHGHGPTTFSPLCMGALMTQQGRRRGYYGDYYYNIPGRSAVKILDSAGRPVPGAQVAFWQDRENVYAGAPVFAGKTDSEGRFLLPNRPAPHISTDRGYTQRDNPFGKISVVGPGNVFFMRIRARSHTEYAWMDIAELNLAYWRTGPDYAELLRKTRIPPEGALPAPAGLAADVYRQEAALTWKPVNGAAGYRIYHAAPDLYEFKPLARAAATSYRATLGNGALHRFAVTAVKPDGTESAFSNTAGAMRFIKPWGIVVTKDGKRLIRDAGYGQAVLQKPNGSSVGLVGSVHYHFEGSYDLALDSKGRLLSAKWGDGYNPRQGFKVQNPDLSLAFEYLKPEGSAPGQVRKPMGIAADSRDHIFVADTGNDRVQEFTPDGKFVQVIGEGELRQPMKVTFDSQDRLYVADSAKNRIAVFERDAQGGFRLAREITGMKEPVYVLVDSGGRVFVSANRNARVHLYDPAGKEIWAYTGTEDTPLSGPRGLALTPDGSLLVVDEATLRVWTLHPPRG